jgi:hypothetical protein
MTIPDGAIVMFITAKFMGDPEAPSFIEPNPDA